MKLLKKPPRHRIDAPITFVHPADEAWDQDKVTKSQEEHGEDCPFLRYCKGETRFDLSATMEHGRVDEFFLAEASPIEFRLMRLGVLEYNDVQSTKERELLQGKPIARAAFLMACRFGLKSVEQDGRKIVDLDSPEDLSVADLQKLADLTSVGSDLPILIGQAVYLASQPLRDDEKKP